VPSQSARRKAVPSLRDPSARSICSYGPPVCRTHTVRTRSAGRPVPLHVPLRATHAARRTRLVSRARDRPFPADVRFRHWKDIGKSTKVRGKPQWPRAPSWSDLAERIESDLYHRSSEGSALGVSYWVCTPGVYGFAGL